jgi:peptidyl-prolyl cis-trans isomerase-like protein 2
VLSEFDHVKKEIDLDSEELKQLKEDPAYGINMSGDTKRILQELGTERGREIAATGGGGDKTQREHAAAVAALKAAKKVQNIDHLYGTGSLTLSIVHVGH